jgi:hypothetical protein
LVQNEELVEHLKASQANEFIARSKLEDAEVKLANISTESTNWQMVAEAQAIAMEKALAKQSSSHSDSLVASPQDISAQKDQNRESWEFMLLQAKSIEDTLQIE